METNYYIFNQAWNKRTIHIGYEYPGNFLALETAKERIAYWESIVVEECTYVEGSKFSTYLSCGTEVILSQEFKDLYEREGWTGLAFSEPIVIHGLKPGLVQPMPYYHVKIVERCERLIGHRWVYPNGCKCLTDWEVVNDGGFSFFRGASLSIWLCQPYVAQAVKRHKLTNIWCSDLADYQKSPYSFEPPDQREY